MFFSSIRFKITLWQIFILSLTLLLFGTLLYHGFHRKLTHDMDNLLRLRAKAVVDSIDTYWETERLEAGRNASRKNFIKQGNINFIKIAQRWVKEKNSDPAMLSLIVRVFSERGRLIASSKNIPAHELRRNIFSEARQGKSHLDDMSIEISKGPPVLFRSLTVPIIENGKLAYIVQVASPLRGPYAALKNLGLLLFTLLPLTALVTGVTGAFLAKLTLRPVHRMIDTIHEITAENLKLRLAIPGTRDEIEALARTFNDMIERLDGSFTSQRRFMEDISHELKTPLSILKGELEITLKKIRSAQEYETTLHSNLEEVERLSGIVENLLVLARFDARTMGLRLERVDLTALVQEAIDGIKVLAEQKNIGIELHSAGSLEAPADRSQIKRLVLNLLDNAIKYTRGRGCIKIDLSRQKDIARINIADTGIGIAQEELARIFDRFYRVDKSRASGGFGLGLSIAHSIAQAHGGAIEVRANVPQGTVFSIILPLHGINKF